MDGSRAKSPAEMRQSFQYKFLIRVDMILNFIVGKPSVSKKVYRKGLRKNYLKLY